MRWLVIAGAILFIALAGRLWLKVALHTPMKHLVNLLLVFVALVAVATVLVIVLATKR